jgi:hypothetical protein
MIRRVDDVTTRLGLLPARLALHLVHESLPRRETCNFAATREVWFKCGRAGGFAFLLFDPFGADA